MGRLAVRRALQTFFQGLGVPYLGTVYPARPVILPEAAYVQTMQGYAIQASPNGSCCVAVVNMPSDQRTRIALVGRSAVDDTNVHKIALELFFASTGGDGLAAQDDYDLIVDTLVTAIRSDATAGDATVIWSAGEFTAGVAHSMDQPYSTSDGLTVLINGVIRFEAWEQPVGTNV